MQCKSFLGANLEPRVKCGQSLGGGLNKWKGNQYSDREMVATATTIVPD